MSVYYEDDTVTLHHGDALTVAGELTAGAVQTIVTSPPYYGLRDYGEDAQLGAESSVGEYVDNMVALFGALRDVLVDDGTVWLNLGDSYANDTKWGGATGGKATRALHGATGVGRGKTSSGLPPKSLMGVPWRVAFGLQDDGWTLRSEIIWHKPNPMPESVTDRPTKSHETIFLFAKNPNYYYDAEAITELAIEADSKAGNLRQGEAVKAKGKIPGSGQESFRAIRERRNKRTVWTVNGSPFPGAHFAVYPPELIRPCILAGSRPGDTVLDPFSGSGTTGMVATQEDRKYVGIDLNSEYLDLSLKHRFAQPTLNFGATA